MYLMSRTKQLMVLFLYSANDVFGLPSLDLVSEATQSPFTIHIQGQREGLGDKGPCDKPNGRRLCSLEPTLEKRKN